MSIPVHICDDSSFARKQMVRALPPDWDIEVSFSGNGLEGLDAIKAGQGEILFLDLNMPVLDGYQVLAEIRKHDLPTLVIVVSGDVQPEAYARVMALGALDFIKKPVGDEQIVEILGRYGIYSRGDGFARGEVREPDIQVDLRDACAEVANVAMGRAADMLARLLGAFVLMPLPRVEMIEISELHMAIHQVAETDSLSAVCQGFIGAGIAGEAFLVFNESSFTDIAKLMKYDGVIDEDVQLELLMDISNILIGACLRGFSEQLDLNFSQGHPVVLGRHINMEDIQKQNRERWRRTLAIEISYSIEDRKINCDLLLLFSEDSIDALNERISYIMD